MKNFFLFFLYIIFSLNGCNENPVKDGTLVTLKIKKVTESGKNFVEFSYEDGVLIKKETKSIGGVIIDSTSFTYDEKGRLIMKDEFSNEPRFLFLSYSIYEYSINNIIQKENVFRKENTDYKLYIYILYEYENNKVKKYNYYSPTNELLGYHILKYENDKIIGDAYYDNKDSLQVNETYEYDNKLNPLNVDLSPISAFTTSKNNITKWIKTDYMSMPPNITTTINTYTYNQYDYPTKCFVDYNRNENGINSRDTSTTFYEYY